MAKQAGRPRDDSIDARAIAATLDLLVEAGFEGTTIQAVSQRSGVHASAIYRRWPSRIELIEAAAFPGLATPAVEPTGDLRRDLRRFVRAYATALGAPTTRAAMLGLLTHYQSAGGVAADRFLRVSARPQFRAILDAAVPPVAADVDPDDVFDLLLGSIVGRAVIPTIAARQRPVERIVDLVHRLLTAT